jgi:hypothetical protein
MAAVRASGKAILLFLICHGDQRSMCGFLPIFFLHICKRGVSGVWVHISDDWYVIMCIV